jgi:polyhydroxyalkanoate synthesis repressor PhaR
MTEEQIPVAPVESIGDRTEPKVIKRYTNRKLYDTVESRYVTLDEIAQMIKGGAEVKIIDNRSKEDLTSVTLAQIIFEEEKKRSHMPLGFLREIIRNGGDAVTGFYQEKVGLKLGERLHEVKSRAESLREEVETRVRGVTSLLRREDGSPVKEILNAGEKALEELRTKVDGTVKQALDAVNVPALFGEMEKLQKKLEAIEKKLEQLGK